MSIYGIYKNWENLIPLLSFPTPYIYTKISVLTLLDASFSPSLLLPAKLSISSIKIIDGFLSLAN